MKILYKHREAGISDAASPLSAFGIGQCYLKHLLVERDARVITKKAHHHTSFEMHIITNGWQIYEAQGTQRHVRSGQFLLIPPLLTHRVIASASGTEKCSIVFTAEKTASALLPVPDAADAPVCETPLQVTDTLDRLLAGGKPKNELDVLLLGNRVFEAIILLLRACGAKECAAPLRETDEDSRLSLAKQFIGDNIRLPLTVTDIAAYINVSEKQLTRLFLQFEGLPPQKYIHRERAHMLERLVLEETLSLREISEQMHFSSEYYLNAFFKRHHGMPPGAYRRMHKAGVDA